MDEGLVALTRAPDRLFEYLYIMGVHAECNLADYVLCVKLKTCLHNSLSNNQVFSQPETETCIYYTINCVNLKRGGQSCVGKWASEACVICGYSGSAG